MTQDDIDAHFKRKPIDEGKVRPTFKQALTAKVTAQAILKGETPTKAQLVERGGYATSMQINPQKVLESKGYLQELAKYGLTKELVTTALKDDIESKVGNRHQELRLGADVLGMRQTPDTQVTVNIPQTLVELFREPDAIEAIDKGDKVYDVPITVDSVDNNKDG